MSQATVEQAFQIAVQYHQAGQLSQAATVYREVLARQPNHAESLHLLGVITQLVGRVDLAVDLIRRAIAIRPDYAQAHSNLGNALFEKGELDAAIAAYRQAIALNPNAPEALSNLGSAMLATGQADEAIAAYRQAIALKGDFPQAHSNLINTLHFHPDYDAQAIYQEQCRWNRQHAEPLKTQIQPHANDRDPVRPLRIGYVSPDLREHVVGQFTLPLLAHHDKNHFEIFAYALMPVPDKMTQRLRTFVDGWRSIAGLSDTEAADLIRRDRVDILVDLTMHMAHNRLQVFARKPAPVQVTYLAYCSSTGLSTIDYRLSDPYLDPPGADESVYSEQTIRLPETYWCYHPTMPAPRISPLPALERGCITFGCLNNFAKVNERVLATWARLLRATPNSQLLLHARQGTHRQRVRQQLEREGIEPGRLEFAGFLPAEQYFDLYRRIDVALDSFPYAGGTTTCDALWSGAAVVSLAGRTAVGRGGLSILSNVGLPELVADSQERYVAIATELANDLPRLGQLRSTLRGRMEQSPVMNAPKFARNVEAAYRRMWRKWCATALP